MRNEIANSLPEGKNQPDSVRPRLFIRADGQKQGKPS